MRVLVVSQMWPGPRDPDLGAFVAQLAGALEAEGHVLERAVIDRRGLPKTKYVRLTLDAVRTARRFRPDVVYGHFLVPAGVAAAAAARAGRAPLVLTAHGTDVANISDFPGIRHATRAVTRRASAVIAVSGWLRDRLVAGVPELAGRVEVIDCGVDLERFRDADQAAARSRVGWEGDGPFYLFAGSLDERKNVVSLVEAFERLGGGQLAVLGDGPLRSRLEGRAGIRLAGRVPHTQMPDWMAAADVVCQPTFGEAFGQSLLEAMASGRPVVATREGGPPEFVTPEAGVLVDPGSVDSIEQGMRAAARLPVPNPAGRQAAAEHDVRLQARRVADVLERAVSAGRR